MDYENHWLFKEISSMSKELRYSIRHMPVEYRYDIGKDLRSALRELKYEAYKVVKWGGTLPPNGDETIIDLLNKVKLIVDECIEDHLLLVTGPYTIIQPRKRLKELLEHYGTTENAQQ